MASMINVNVLGASSYSSELQGAYDYAYGVGITTQSSIDSANLYGSLLRGPMAKMMSNYAKEVLGKTPDTSKACAFNDVSNETQEIQGYIVEACQLGLMGVNNDGTTATTFNPKGVVTRAQFGTVLDRALNGDKNNGGDPYYANHLTALQAAGVMSNISNPNAPEVRGYVMLMMKRADESGVATTTPATCSTPENTLACALGLATCPVECKAAATTEVKAGNLNVSLNSNSAANGTQVPSTGTVRFAVVDFSASSSSDVSLKTVQLKKVGLASIPSSTRIRFEKNGIRVSGKAAFSSDGNAVISFAPIFVVKAGSTESLDLYVDLATSAGQDFQFASTTVDSTAQGVNGSFTTPSLRTATYTVIPVDLTGTSSTATYNASTNGVELGAFTLTMNKAGISDTRDLKLNSITLRQNGNGNLSNLSDIVLERNGVVVGKNPTVNGKDLTFSVGDTIKDSTTATYYIKAVVNNVDNNAGDHFQFLVRTTSDVNVVELTSAFRSTITLGGTTTVTFSDYVVNGGDITFSRDSSVALAKNYAQGTDGVTLMQGAIKVNAPMTLENPVIPFTTANVAGDLSKMFSTIYLVIGSSTFSYSPVTGNTSAPFLGSVTINSTANVRMYGKLKDTSGTGYVKFNDLALSSFSTTNGSNGRAEYVSNSNTVSTAIGSIPGVAVTSQAATLNVTRSDALGNTTIAGGSKNVEIYGLKLTSDQGNGVKISRVVLDVTGSNASSTTGHANNVTLNLYANGTIVASKTVTTASTVTFDGLNQTVTVGGSGLVLDVKADFTDAFAGGSFQVTLNSTNGLNATDVLTSNSVTYNKPAGATFTIAPAAAALALSTNNPNAQLLLSPVANQKIVAFKVSATNDNVTLNDVALTGTNLSNLSNFRLADSSLNVFATAATTTATTVTFTNTVSAPVITKDQTATFYVLADVNSNTTGTVAMSVIAAGTDVKSSNGTTVNVTGGPVVSNTHALDLNTVVVTQLDNAATKSLQTNALRFSVYATGKNSITLTGLTFNNSLTQYTGNAQLIVYKDVMDANHIAGSSAAGAGLAATTIALTGNNSINSTIDAGTTATYIVVFQGATLNGNNADSWTVSLTKVYFGGYDASAYANIGSFPITQSK